MLRAMPTRSIIVLMLVGSFTSVLAVPARATVSIVAVDPATGEIGVAAASCVQFDLARIATVLPGVGAAVSQGHQRREDPLRLLEAMRDGGNASETLDRVASAGTDPGGRTRQFGVVMLGEGASALTGDRADPVAADASAATVVVVGTELERGQVVTRAKEAFLQSSGDLAHRLLAGLKASSVAGGDRRCHSQSATSAFMIVASPGEDPVAPIRGLPGVARRRAKVLEMVGRTVAADELGDLLRDAAGLRRPTGPGGPDVYLSLIQPKHAFNAVTLLAQAYRQLLSTPTATPTPIPTTSPTTTAGPAQTGGGGSIGISAYLWLAVAGILLPAGLWGRHRQRRRRDRRAVANAVSRTRT
jgi:hypothetical protein